MTKRLLSSLSFLLPLMAETALAMPGAPMLPLSAFAPGCGDLTADRSVILHPAEGPVYENDLPDWAEVLQLTIMHYESSGEFERRRQKTVSDMEAALESPRGAVKLPRAVRKDRRVIPFPEELKRFDLRMSQGDDLQKKVFLLIDGDDEAQRRWAKTVLDEEARQKGIAAAQVVLISGKRSLVLKELGDDAALVRVLLDQGGQMRRMLGVSALPVRAAFSLEGWEVEAEVLEEHA
ncbi:hypothetical protein [uncultured Sutterella sp.]|uniref:hypothetical protein n=1 Tax=uncultured Sutterella sp. TaxID=286133 RepID=UPI00259B0F76|nr:hypothetical protein [uncultured Sutterella sp.]